MVLSREAREFADEIRSHDWSDAPFRLDRAGHRRDLDSKAGDRTLSQWETETVRGNVIFVVAQVLKHKDPGLDLDEFTAACGDPAMAGGVMRNGVRFDPDGLALAPGQWFGAR
jgi:hypothetical protein